MNGVNSDIFYSKVRKDLKEAKEVRRDLIKELVLQSDLMQNKEVFLIFAEMEYSVENLECSDVSVFFEKIVRISSNNKLEFVTSEEDMNRDLIPLNRGEFTFGYLKFTENNNKKDQQLLTRLRNIKSLLCLIVDYLQSAKETENNLKKLEILNNITLIINSSLNIDEVYKGFAQEIRKIIDFDRISIATIEEDNIVVFGIDASMDTKLARGKTIPKKNTAPWWVTKNKRSHIATDLQKNPQFIEDKILAEEGIRSALRVPLWIKGHIIGTLNLNSTKPNLYGYAEKLLVEQVGRQIATGIQNAQLFEERQRKNEEIEKQNIRLGTLNSIARAVGNSLELDITLKKALSKVVEVMGTEAGAIFLLDEESGKLQLKIHQGILGNCLTTEDSNKLINEGIASKVVRTGEPVVFYNGQVRHTGCLFHEKANFKMVAYLPLKSKNKVLGVMPIGTEKEIGVSNRDWEILVGIGNQIGVAIENAQLYQKIKHMAEFDGLTEVYNRRVFFRLLEQEISRSERYDSTFSLMIADVDLFKDYNDRYGHLAGDEALREVASIMKENIRETDIVARYGGEEFVIISVNSSKQLTYEIAERIRIAIEERGQKRAFPTVSVGISTFPEDGTEVDTLIQKADAALYLAKEKRNACAKYETHLFEDIRKEAK